MAPHENRTVFTRGRDGVKLKVCIRNNGNDIDSGIPQF